MSSAAVKPRPRTRGISSARPRGDRVVAPCRRPILGADLHPLGRDLAPGLVPGHGQVGGASHRCDPRQRRKVAFDLLEELRPLFRGHLVAVQAHGDPRRPLGLEARVHAHEPNEAVGQDAGARDQHHREPGLHHHEQAPQAAPAAGPRARAVPERLTQAPLPQVERGHEPEEDTRERGKGEAEEEDPARDSNLAQPRDPARAVGSEAFDPQVRDSDAGEPGQERQHQRLHQELAGETAAPGPQAGPDRHLPFPLRGPHQEEVGHVGARDQ